MFKSELKINGELHLENNQNWFAGYVKLSMLSKHKAGLPMKEFEESNDRSKRLKTKYLREHLFKPTLIYAAQMSLRSAGKIDAFAIKKENKFSDKSIKSPYSNNDIPTRKDSINGVTTMKAALSMFMEADLTQDNTT